METALQVKKYNTQQRGRFSGTLTVIAGRRIDTPLYWHTLQLNVTVIVNMG